MSCDRMFMNDDLGSGHGIFYITALEESRRNTKSLRQIADLLNTKQEC
jgi:hypothetical protein